jgi:hypothetical protein
MHLFRNHLFAGPDSCFVRRVDRFRTTIGELPETIRDSSKTVAATITVPAATVLSIYGLTDSRPTESIVRSATSLNSTHPHLAKAVRAVTWSIINFDITQIGINLSNCLSFLGKSIGSSTAFTLAYIHPSIISIALQKIRGEQKRDVMARYLEAIGVPQLLAYPTFFATMNLIVNPENITLVGVAKAITAALVASAAGTIVFATTFTAYWIKIVRKEPGYGSIANLKEFVKGIHWAIQTLGFKELQTPKSVYGETGALVGLDLFLWAPIAWATRGAVAVFIALNGVTGDSFSGMFMSVLSAFDMVGSLISGVRNSIVERLLKENEK